MCECVCVSVCVHVYASELASQALSLLAYSLHDHTIFDPLNQRLNDRARGEPWDEATF